MIGRVMMLIVVAVFIVTTDADDTSVVHF